MKFNMDKTLWNDFRKNALVHLWECENNNWISALYNSKIKKLAKYFPKYTKKLYLKYVLLRFKIIKRPIIPILEYVVTTRCTMNCKNCNTFIPYFSSKTHIENVSFDTFKDDIDKLLKSLDYINMFGFVGGEPLLNPNLYKMIEYACQQKQIKHVFVATNCTIIPNDKLIKALKHKKVGVQISNYSHVKNIKNGVRVKHYEVKDLLEKNKIKISDPHKKTNSNSWQTMPKIYPDMQNRNEIIKNYDTCFGRFCYMFSDGLILQCCVCVYMTRNLKIDDFVKSEIVDVRNSDNSDELRNSIINFLSKRYSKFCNYCHFVDMKYGLPCAQQLEEIECKN